MLASDSREVERPRQVDVHSKVPHVQRVRLSIGTYDLINGQCSKDLPGIGLPAHLGCCPNTGTVDDAPQWSTILFRPRDDLVDNLGNVVDLGDVQLPEFSPAGCQVDSSCVRRLYVQYGDISLLLKDVSGCRKPQARRA